MCKDKLMEHFKKTSVFERKQADWFVEEFGVQLEKIPQEAGCVGDYVIIKHSDYSKELFGDLTTIEFKNDKYGIRSGALYFEFEQTNDYWETRKPSGHLKAANEKCILVVQSGEEVFIFMKRDVDELVPLSHKTMSTRNYCNGNKPGMFTRGHIISKKFCKSHCKFHSTGL